MVVYLEDPRKSMTKLTQKKKILKVAGCKVNIQKPTALIYTNNNQVEVLRMEENAVYNSNKEDKVLINKLNKNVQNL